MKLKHNVFSAPQNVDDYEQKYPADAYGEEMGPSARVWRMYLDEAQKADTELVEGWRDTTDVLLVFVSRIVCVQPDGLTSSIGWSFLRRPRDIYRINNL